MERYRLAVCGLLGMLALTGCGQSSSWPFGNTALTGTQELASRPTLPEIVTTYEALMREMRTALNQQLGAVGWSTKGASTPTALCQDFGTEPDTGLRTLPFILYEHFVPQPAWRKVAATISQTARRRGFDRAVHVVDRSDEHRIELFDHYGATLSVQDGPRLLSIGLITGCHLRASATSRT